MTSSDDVITEQFSAWSYQMEMAMQKDRLWDIVSGRETAPVDNPDAVAAFEERSRDALS